MSVGRKPCRYTPAALRDLEAIWSFTAVRWSADQADNYVSGLSDAVELIGDNPKLARERSEFTPPVRIARYRSHIIVYREEDDHVSIIRIRHGHEDWASDPVFDQISGGTG